MRFSGRERHTVDAKGRLSMPLRFRETVFEHAKAKDASTLVLVPWFDECIRVFPKTTWAERLNHMEAQLEHVDSFGYSEEESDLRRLIFGMATPVQMDGHGRIVLPVDLREVAQIERDLYWVGIGSCLELWNPDRLTTQLGGDRARTLRKRLSELGTRHKTTALPEETPNSAGMEDSP
ncbi:MAG: MraZ protein [Bradymonadia bacterium]|jgi:MraZ protein